MDLDTLFLSFFLLINIIIVLISSGLIKTVLWIFNLPIKYYKSRASKPKLDMSKVFRVQRKIKGSYRENCPKDKAYELQYSYTTVVTFDFTLTNMDIKIEDYFVYVKTEGQSWLRKHSIFSKYHCYFDEPRLKRDLKQAAEYAFFSIKKEPMGRVGLSARQLLKREAQITFGEIKTDNPTRRLKVIDGFCCGCC